MGGTKSWRQALAEDYRIVASALVEKKKFTIYRSLDRMRYVIHQRTAGGDSVYKCGSLGELAHHLRILLPLGAFVEVSSQMSRSFLASA